MSTRPTPWQLLPLEDLGIVRVRGPDVTNFLQGQLSNDVSRLSATRSVLAGYHNPQGRAIALLRLAQWEPQDLLAIVPRELTAVVVTRLAKFVLRAKVRLVDDSPSWRVLGLVGGSVQDRLPATALGQARLEGSLFIRVPAVEARWLVVSPAERVAALSDAFASGTEGDVVAMSSATSPHSALRKNGSEWQRFEVSAGLPEVYAATSEKFVAQMLNLDALGAIAFDKGCYTGQEVIARAHYRGRLKRRMQRFVTREAGMLAPAESRRLRDGRTVKVVRAAALADGRCEFLAVAPLQAESEAEEAQRSEMRAAGEGELLEVDPLPLPYALPD